MLHMDRMRVRGLAIPGWTAVPLVNLRLYVRHEGRPAVRFIQELVPSRLVAAVARWRYGEPFRAAVIRLDVVEDAHGRTATCRFGPHRPSMFVRVTGSRDTAIPGADTFEHWVKERGRGCRTGPDGALRTFDVEHPPWAVRRVESWDYEVRFAALYGAHWAFLDSAAPPAVVYAVGSDVAVSEPA